MNTLFTKEGIMKLLNNERDAFDFVQVVNSRYVLYTFDRDDNVEARLECHYLDHFNQTVEHLHLGQIIVNKTEDKVINKSVLFESIVALLNEHRLLEGK